MDVGEPSPATAALMPTVMLVVNADEFGLTEAISRGILTAHRSGIVTSTSLLGHCEDLAGAKRLLDQAPELGVGLHLSLMNGRPMSDPAKIPALVQRKGEGAGTFPATARDHLLKWLKAELPPDQIEREFAAQIDRARAAGIEIDHLDTHHHIGFLPPVARAVESLARRFGIPGVRSTGEQPTLGWITDLARGALASLVGGLAWLTRRQMGALRHGPITWGYAEAGRLDEVRILEVIGRLGPGSHELICHPGEVDDAEIEQKPGQANRTTSAAPVTPAAFGFLPTAPFRRTRELAALTSPLIRHALLTRGVRLCRWRDLF